jgi:hypothetical protein
MYKLIPAVLLSAAALCAPATFGAEPDPGDAPPGHEGPSFGRTGHERRSGAARPAAPAARRTEAAVPAAADSPPRAARQAPAEQAALEEKVPHEGPTFGKSRVERRRDKCGAIAKEQGLSGAALEQHTQACVKR